MDDVTTIGSILGGAVAVVALISAWSKFKEGRDAKVVAAKEQATADLKEMRAELRVEIDKALTKAETAHSRISKVRMEFVTFQSYVAANNPDYAEVQRNFDQIMKAIEKVADDLRSSKNGL